MQPGHEALYPMSILKTPFELYKLLPKTNCGQCGISTCLAFAAAVLKEEKELSACPFIDANTLSRLEGKITRQVNLETIQESSLRELQKKIATVDVTALAARLGARSTEGTIIVQCLGKDFEIDARGSVMSQCHTHAWFSVPLLSYLLFSKGEELSGRWVPFRDLAMGGKWAPLFERRCERPLKQLADAYGELFEDLITLFCGTSSRNEFASDISVVLYPLPKVPLLICYWKREGDMDSKLHLFFDETAERNLPLDSLFTLGTGIVRMLEKIVQKHTGAKRDIFL